MKPHAEVISSCIFFQLCLAVRFHSQHTLSYLGLVWGCIFCLILFVFYIICPLRRACSYSQKTVCHFFVSSFKMIQGNAGCLLRLQTWPSQGTWHITLILIQTLTLTVALLLFFYFLFIYIFLFYIVLLF